MFKKFFDCFHNKITPEEMEQIKIKRVKLLPEYYRLCYRYRYLNQFINNSNSINNSNNINNSNSNNIDSLNKYDKNN